MMLDTEKQINYDFSLLPAHIIARIFVHLDKKSFTSACLVCHNWLYASHDPIVTRTIQLCIDKRKLNQAETYKNIIRPFNRLKVISCNFKGSTKYLDFFKNFGPNLYEIEFNSCTIRNDQLLQIMLYTKNLLTLRLINVFHLKSDPQFNPCDEMRCEINNTLNKIKVFEVQSNRSTDVSSLGWELLANLTNLKVLIFSLNFSFSLFGWKHSDLQVLVDVINGWDNIGLCELHLDGDFRMAFNTLKFYSIISNLKIANLKTLRTGKFSHGTTMDSYIDLYGREFTMFCQNFSKLEELDIDGICTWELRYLFQYMVNLKSLKIRNGNIKQFTGIENLKLLQELSISDPFEHPQVNELFTSNLPNLKILHVFEFNIEKNSLDLICQNFKNLVDLRIKRLTTDECEIIFTSLVNLKTLHLYFDCTVNQQCNVSKLAKLEEIWISGNRAKVIDSQVFIKSKHCD